MNIDQVVLELRNENRNVEWADDAVDRRIHVTRRAGKDGLFPCVTAFNLTEDVADSVILGEIDSLGNQSFEWKTYSFDLPMDLVERLVRFGFEPGAPEAVMVYDLLDGLTPFEGAHECSIRKADSATGIADYRAVAESVFRKDFSVTSAQLARGLAAEFTGHEAYIAIVDSRPIAVGRLYTDLASLFAGLYGGGTLAEFRGRGYYRALIAERAKVAFARGARYLMVDALPTSGPILERLGFVKIAETTPYLWRGK